MALWGWLAGGSQLTDSKAQATLVGAPFEYVVTRGESLSSIGARKGVSAAELARQNRLPVNSGLQIGQCLLIDNRHLIPERLAEGVLMNIPQRMLFLFEKGALVARYPVAVGRKDWTTATKTGTAFATFHEPGRRVNRLTGRYQDDETGTPEYKLTAVAVTLVNNS